MISALFARSWKLFLLGLVLLVAGGVVGFVLLAHGKPTATPQPIAQQRQPTPTAPPACVQLPQHFDWQHLSEQDFAKYGLPQPPTSLADLGPWLLLMQNLKHRSCRISIQPLSRIHPAQQPARAQEAQSCPIGQGCQNPTWAGGIADQHAYEQVEATWSLPCLKTIVKNSSTSAWVGLGGAESNATLVQAGVDTDVDANGALSYYAWAEAYTPASATAAFHDSQAELVFEQGLHCGDTLYVQVSSDIKGSVDAQYPDTFFMGDLTTGEYEYYNPSWSGSDGSSADWIVEQPTFVSGQTLSFKPLSDFGNLTFAFCLAYVEQQGLQSDDQLPLQLVSMQGTTLPLATAARTAPASISVQWLRAH